MKNFLLIISCTLLCFSCSTDNEEINELPSQGSTIDGLKNSTIEVSGTFDRVRRSDHHINNNIWSRASGQNNNGTGNQTVWSYDMNNWGTYGNHFFGDGQIKSYPSIIIGQHYNDGAGDSENMPIRIRDISSAVTSWSTQCNYDNGNTSYDIWFDSDRNESGENSHELMIWLHRSGLNPIAHAYDANGAVPRFSNVRINGINFNVYETFVASGLRVMSFVTTSNRRSVSNINIKDFADYCVDRGWMSNSLYMTSVQAGFEIVNGTNFDCKATSFSLNVN